MQRCVYLKFHVNFAVWRKVDCQLGVNPTPVLQRRSSKDKLQEGKGGSTASGKHSSPVDFLGEREYNYTGYL